MFPVNFFIKSDDNSNKLSNWLTENKNERLLIYFPVHILKHYNPNAFACADDLVGFHGSSYDFLNNHSCRYAFVRTIRM